MQHFEPLIAGNFYHLYNHSVGKRDLFLSLDNYEYFLSLYDKYITPVAETFAWVLMPNHFHLLVQIKENTEVVDITIPDRVLNPVRDKVNKVGTSSQQFSKLFNAYSQALNKRLGCHGALFERPFKRKLIDNETYLKQVILYIHNNPVHHGFCTHPLEYAWSSYATCVSVKPTKLNRDTVIGWFNNEENFKNIHETPMEIETIGNIENLLEL
jgi:putative transposase